MAAIYEYWQHRMTGEVWAVKLDRGRVVGAVEIYRRDVNVELLPFLTYHRQEARNIEQQRHEYRTIDGRRRAPTPRRPTR